MNFFQAFCTFLNSQCTRPDAYGAYHLFCMLLTAVLTVLAIHIGRHHDARQVNRVLLGTAVLVIVLELYKQFNYTFGDGSGQPHFQWYAFPFQFCSTPMYVGLLAALLRRGRVHDCLCAYLASYAVFAGLCVMFYPGDVFIRTIGINIQTMVCHGSMVIIGAYLLSSGHVTLEPATLLKAVPVFVSCVCIAFALNELAHRMGITDFNMFFISPYVPCTLPVYSLIHENLPFPVNTLLYVLGFTAAAGIVLLLAALIRHVALRLRQKCAYSC